MITLEKKHFISLLALVFFLALISLVQAWSGPTQAPPNGNVSPPINVGTTDQVKNAGLSVNAFTVFGNSLISGAGVGLGRYLNFDYTPDASSGTGESGYGIRDNAGVMEFKNAGGSWCPFTGCSTAGSQKFTVSGTFNVPVAYTSLTVQCWGGGGGGGGDGNSSSNGGAGGASSFLTVNAGGGSGGVDNGGGGSGGSASGGNVNVSGNAGLGGTSSQSGAGGSAPNGGQGGSGVPSNTVGNTGSLPGGAGSGGKGSASGSGGGGSGGYSSRTYTTSQLAPDSTVAVTVGLGGAAGSGQYPGGVGVRGECQIDWN